MVSKRILLCDQCQTRKVHEGEQLLVVDSGRRGLTKYREFCSTACMDAYIKEHID